MIRRRWPLRWPLNLLCSHPSTSGVLVQNEDGTWSDTEIKCLRCGRDLAAVEVTS